MVSVVYYPKIHRVTVQGHANSDGKGDDLVCAAVSILTYTLAANALELKHLGCTQGDVVTKLEEGYSEVLIIPKRRKAKRAAMAFEAVCIGYELLAQQYPQYVQYEEKK